MPTETEQHEREHTHHALVTLNAWGQDPNSDGGENIAFSLSRQGAPSDAFLVLGDCTPYTAHGARGSLRGQPSGDTGEPTVYVDDFGGSVPTLDSFACTFDFDLNTGSVALTGAFPGLGSSLSFEVEYLKSFHDDAGVNVLFVSRASSDHAGYVLAVQHVAAS